MRIGTPWSAAARAISPTLSSNFLMLPGLTRTAAQPASMAAKTYFGWKWMSAMTGICDFLAMIGSASASSWDGTATRTIWQPDAVSSAICCNVALTSAVTVVVIDCTETGASPPTGTLPTMIWRECRRSASGLGRTVGMPRATEDISTLTVTTVSSLGSQRDSSIARARAQASAASTSSTESAGVTWCSSTTLATVSTIARNGSSPRMNASRHASLAAL